MAVKLKYLETKSYQTFVMAILITLTSDQIATLELYDKYMLTLTF